ncbi:MAG: hypothetical protein FWE40_04295 [Oscillospiraceae bacterium]|nr:hypothetical protein [Oscillospiraceae bacterium]
MLDVICTPGYEVFLEQSISKSEFARIENVFNRNDGPEPYHFISAEVVWIQQAISELEFQVQRNMQTLTGSVQVFIHVVYTDGFHQTRSKFVTIFMPIESAAFSTPEDIECKYNCCMEEASLEDVALLDNQLSFSYTISCKLLITDAQAKRLPVIEHVERNAQQHNLPTKKAAICPVSKVCELSHELSSFQAGIIPFSAQEAQAVAVVGIDVLPGFTLLDVSSQWSTTTLSVAFPVSIELALIDDTFSTQSSYLFAELTVEGFPPSEDMRLFVDLDFMHHEWWWPHISGNVIVVPSGTIHGSISLAGDAATKKLAAFVDCGPVEPCQCVQAPPISSTTQL